jgi:hypothetical protein
VECELVGENEVLEENLPPVSLCPPQIPHDLGLGSNLGRRVGKPATNRLSYGTVNKDDNAYSCQIIVLYRTSMECTE